MKTSQKIFLAVCAIAVLCILVVSASVTASSSQANAQSAYRSIDRTSKRTTEVIQSIEKLDNSKFNFPHGFGNCFEDKKNVKRDIRARRLVSKFIPQNTSYANYINELDQLYLKCVKISNKNDKVNTKKARIKDQTVLTRELSRQFHQNRKTIDTDFNNIMEQNLFLRQNLERLYADRFMISRMTNKPIDKHNAERILQGLEYRYVLLKSVHSDIARLQGQLALLV